MTVILHGYEFFPGLPATFVVLCILKKDVPRRYKGRSKPDYTRTSGSLHKNKKMDHYQDFAPVLVIFLEGLIGPGGFV